MIKELAPVILITGAKIPYSPLERGTRASAELISMIRYFGLTNCFLTVGPDEKRTAIIARVAGSIYRDDTRHECDSIGAFWNREQNETDQNKIRSNFGLLSQLLPNQIPSLNEGVVIWREEI